MQITIKLFATLREGRFDSKTVELPEGTTVGDIIQKLNISEKEAAIVFINSRHAGFERVLQDGDILGMFPPVGGG